MTRRRTRFTPITYPITIGTQSAKVKRNASSDWEDFPSASASPQLVSTLFNRLWSDVEITLDELHPGPPYKTGGPFDNFKAKDPSLLPLQNKGHYECIYPDFQAKYNGVDYSNVWPKYWYTYDGGFPTSHGPLASLATLRDEKSSAWTSAGCIDVSSYGPAGWKKFQPIKPVIDVGTSAYELRELPRMLKTTATGFVNLWKSMGGHPTKMGPKELANQWLNFNFGWRPFLGDLAKLFSFQKKLAAKYQYLVNANGKWKKRGGKVATIESSSVTNYTSSGHYPYGLSSAWTSYGYARDYARVYDTRKTEVWFEGAFRFWIPNLEPYDLWAKDYIHHLGLNISPSLVYNLTPWTWLIDWFTNLGDVIDNYSSTGSGQYAASYAYIMGHTQRIKRVESMLPFGGNDLYATWEFPLERKQRVAANPFGFGLNWNQLTPVQWSILGALGLTRLT